MQRSSEVARFMRLLTFTTIDCHYICIFDNYLDGFLCDIKWSRGFALMDPLSIYFCPDVFLVSHHIDCTMIPDIIETHVAIDQSESPTSSPEQTLAARIRQKQNATSPSPTLTKHGLAASVAQLSTETQSPDLTPATKHRLTQATSEYQLLPGRSSALAGASTGHARKGTRNDDSDMGRRRFNPHAAAGRSKSYASELQNASSQKISTGDGKTHMDSSHGETTHNSDNTRVSRVFDQTKGESRRSAMLLHVEHDGMLSGSRSSLFPGGWKGSGVSMAGSMSLIEENTENNTEFGRHDGVITIYVYITTVHAEHDHDYQPRARSLSGSRSWVKTRQSIWKQPQVMLLD